MGSNLATLAGLLKEIYADIFITVEYRLKDKTITVFHYEKEVDLIVWYK
jgi:hypothetical protein